MSSVYARGPGNLIPNMKARPMTAGGTIMVTNYPLPKNSPPKGPSFSFSKDKSQNFLAIAQRNGSKMPGPGDYEIRSWFDTPKKKTSKGSYSLQGERKFEIDDVIRIAKNTPGPGTFNPKRNFRVIGGMNVKSDRNSFLDECEYLGREIPGAGVYEPKYASIEAKTRTPMYRKPKKVEHWKPKKTNDPDWGTYEHWESYKKTIGRPGTAKMTTANIKSFNELASDNKKHVPGSGHYNPESAYSHIYRPMKKGRR